MAWALSIDGTTVATTRGREPDSARRLDTGGWMLFGPDAGPAMYAECGWAQIVDTPRPVDPDTEWIRTVEMVAGVPTVVWVAGRDLTAENADIADREAKGANVAAAVATLRQWAQQSATTNVTNGNNTTVTQTLVDRLGVFFDRFADLIESQRFDDGGGL